MNKKTLMIESCEKKTVEDDFSNTSIAHVRNSKIMERELGYKLITHISQIPDALSESWDNIVCHYASPYMKYKAYMEILNKNPKARIFWLVSDHDLEDNVLIRNYIKKDPLHNTFDTICNNLRGGYRHWILGKNLEGKKLNDFIKRWHTVNLNSLIFVRPQDLCENTLSKSGIIYFGTPRKWRFDDMKRFNGLNDYTISSSTKNQSKYDDAGITYTNYMDKLSWKSGEETLAKFKYSIYFEDESTHQNYAFPANRYYECVSMNVLLFFDARCSSTIATMREQGYNIPDFVVVDSPEDLNNKMKMVDSDAKVYFNLLDEQRKNVDICMREKTFVLERIKSILNK
jgi:hypothetical protein